MTVSHPFAFLSPHLFVIVTKLHLGFSANVPTHTFCIYNCTIMWKQARNYIPVFMRGEFVFIPSGRKQSVIRSPTIYNAKSEDNEERERKYFAFLFCVTIKFFTRTTPTPSPRLYLYIQNRDSISHINRSCLIIPKFIHFQAMLSHWFVDSLKF